MTTASARIHPAHSPGDYDRNALANGVRTAVDRLLNRYLALPADPANLLEAEWLAGRLALITLAVGPVDFQDPARPAVGALQAAARAETVRVEHTAVLRPLGPTAASAPPPAVVICRKCSAVAAETDAAGWAVGPDAGFGTCPACGRSGPEQREAPRLPCALPAACVVAGGGTDGGPGRDVWPGVVRDLSVGGAGLALGRRFEPGTELAMEVAAGGREVQLAGRVVHARADGGGWVHGVAFARPLTEWEFRALLAAPRGDAAGG